MQIRRLRLLFKTNSIKKKNYVIQGHKIPQTKQWTHVRNYTMGCNLIAQDVRKCFDASLRDITEKIYIKYSVEDSFVKLRNDPGSLRVEDKVSTHPSIHPPLTFLLLRYFNVKLLSVFSMLLFSFHPFKDPTTLTFHACNLYLHTYLHSKASCSFPLNFQETGCLPSSISHTALILFPFKLQPCRKKNTHTHTPTQRLSTQTAFCDKKCG